MCRSLHDVMRWFKTMATNEYICCVKKGVLKLFNKRLFQKSFHDHIIRGKKDYQKIWEYIDTNPLKWELDCFYNSETERLNSPLRLLSLQVHRISHLFYFCSFLNIVNVDMLITLPSSLYTCTLHTDTVRPFRSTFALA